MTRRKNDVSIKKKKVRTTINGDRKRNYISHSSNYFDIKINNPSKNSETI